MRIFLASISYEASVVMTLRQSFHLSSASCDNTTCIHNAIDFSKKHYHNDILKRFFNLVQ